MSVSFSTIIQKARPSPTHIVQKGLRDATAKIPLTTVSTLPNGFRVAAEEHKSPFATIGLYASVGSRHDIHHGTAQVVEALNLRSTNNLTDVKLAAAVEEIGGHLSVETGREKTSYVIKVRKENAGKAVSILADIIRNGSTADADIEAAKAIAQHRRKVGDEDVDGLLTDMLHRCAYDSTDTGLGSPLLGTEDGINKITKADITAFRTHNYTAPRFVLAASGGVSHKELEGHASRHFGDLSSVHNKNTEKARYVGGDIKLWNIRYKLCHVAFGVETAGINSGDTVPLNICKNVHYKFHRSQHDLGQHAIHRVMKCFASMDFGGGSPMGSSHFPEQSIENHESIFHAYSDTGLIGAQFAGRQQCVSAGDSGSIHQILQYTMADWCRMAQKCLHNKELEQAKVNYKAQLLFNMDGTTNSVDDIGTQVLYHGRRVPLEEMYQRIDDVTVTNAQEVLHHYYFSRKPVLAFLGYIYPAPGYDMSTQWTYKYWY